MAQIIVNPDELRNFARHLEQLVEGLRSRQHSADSKFKSLHQTWRDAKYARFEKVFEGTCKQLDEFTKSAVAYAEYLKRKARPIDRFLGH